MSTLIDTTKPVWRVSGFIPDGRRMTCFVNANDESWARDFGKLQGLVSVDKVWEIDVETGLRKTLDGTYGVLGSVLVQLRKDK